MSKPEERFKAPPILPPHLLQVILNKDTGISVSTPIWSSFLLTSYKTVESSCAFHCWGLLWSSPDIVKDSHLLHTPWSARHFRI